MSNNSGPQGGHTLNKRVAGEYSMWVEYSLPPYLPPFLPSLPPSLDNWSHTRTGSQRQYSQQQHRNHQSSSSVVTHPAKQSHHTSTSSSVKQGEGSRRDPAHGYSRSAPPSHAKGLLGEYPVEKLQQQQSGVATPKNFRAAVIGSAGASGHGPNNSSLAKKPSSPPPPPPPTEKVSSLCMSHVRPHSYVMLWEFTLLL